jgi:hypothetical protein
MLLIDRAGSPLRLARAPPGSGPSQGAATSRALEREAAEARAWVARLDAARPFLEDEAADAAVARALAGRAVADLESLLATAAGGGGGGGRQDALAERLVEERAALREAEAALRAARARVAANLEELLAARDLARYQTLALAQARAARPRPALCARSCGGSRGGELWEGRARWRSHVEDDPCADFGRCDRRKALPGSDMWTLWWRFAAVLACTV